MTPDGKSPPLFLAGDIGGTHTRLGLFRAETARPLPEIRETFSSRESSSLEAILDAFIDRHPVPVAGACFGIAGPVTEGRSRTTNLPWEIDGERIRRRFDWPKVRLINDLTATAMAIPVLSRRELLSINPGRRPTGYNLALVAPGTGLGMALLVGMDDRPVPVESEGGHADFSPACREEIELWSFLHARFGHVSIERVLSGPGLVNIYSWLRETGKYREPGWLSRALQSGNPARTITEAALNRKTPIARAALTRFVSIFGAVSGNLALTGMATGGVYLGGGIPPRILPLLREGLFMAAFIDKGRFKKVLQKIPVRVILNDGAALLGAARCAAENL